MEYINYAIPELAVNEKNLVFLDNSQASDYRGIDPVFLMEFDSTRLVKQSKVFSDNVSTIGYINFPKTLKCKSNEVEDNLQQMFIYSRVKCLFNGLFFNNFSEVSSLGYCFAGDSAFFETLINPRYGYIRDGFQVNLSIKPFSDAEKKIIALEVMERFPFLRDMFHDISESSFGSQQFYSLRFEKFFNHLSEDYYSRSYIDKTGRGKPLNDKMDKGQTQANRGNSNNDIEFSRGELAIVDLSMRHHKAITDINNTPILNSFIYKDKLYYAKVSNGKDVKNNISFIFSKCYNIILSSKGDTSITRYYSSYNIEELDHLITCEVYNVCRFKCLYKKQRSLEQSSFLRSSKIISTAKKIVENSDLNLSIIFEKIVENIPIDSNDEYDLDELYNLLLDMGKNKQ